MQIVISDVPNQEFFELFPVLAKNARVISDSGTIQSCTGCFGCWTKTPGRCVLRDGYENIGELFAQTDELILISECVFGMYSPFVKNVIDRSISFLLPYFVTKKNETHHKPRYKNRFAVSVYFYGSDISDEEKLTAERLVAAHCINFYASQHTVRFFTSIREIAESGAAA